MTKTATLLSVLRAIVSDIMSVGTHESWEDISEEEQWKKIIVSFTNATSTVGCATIAKLLSTERYAQICK